MKAVYISKFGGPENLEIREVPTPHDPPPGYVLIRVRAAGLNRADLLQRRGLYPPPAGVSPYIPGLEFAGEIVAIGEDVPGFKAGDRVFGITAGKAQAEFLLTRADHIALIPKDLSYTQAAAVPEAFMTAHDALFTLARLEAGESLLIHAVASGVGLAALQVAKASGATVFGTSRNKRKLESCRPFGLDEAISTDQSTGFVDAISEKTGGAGVNVILDLVGGAYFEPNLRCLAQEGRLLLVGLTGGSRAEFDLSAALKKRLTIIGTTLRGRSADEKAGVTRRFIEYVVPLLKSGVVRPNVDRVYPIGEVRAAHEYLESNASFGKVILEF